MTEPSVIDETRRIRGWLLGLLRFAITLERGDREVVMGLATEMDRLGSDNGQSGFRYFTGTSAKLCDCMVAKRDIEKLAVLRVHIDKIADDSLRRAFEGVLFAGRNGSGHFRKQDREYLWKGLPVR